MVAFCGWLRMQKSIFDWSDRRISRTGSSPFIEWSMRDLACLVPRMGLGHWKGLWILVTGCEEDLLFTEWVDRDLIILSGFAPWSKFTRGADNIAGQFVFPPSQERRTSTRRSLIYIVYSLICSEGIYNELFSFIVLNTSVCGGGETEKRQFAFVYENNKDSGKLIWIHLLSLLYHHRSSHNAWDLLEDPWIWVFFRWSGLVV